MTGTRPGYTTASATSTARTWPLTAAVPRITGDPKTGSTLWAAPGTWGPGTVRLAYQWKVDGKAVSSARSATFSLTPKRKGHRISVTVTARRTGHESGRATTRTVVVR